MWLPLPKLIHPPSYNSHSSLHGIGKHPLERSHGFTAVISVANVYDAALVVAEKQRLLSRGGPLSMPWFGLPFVLNSVSSTMYISVYKFGCVFLYGIHRCPVSSIVDGP